MEIIEIEKEVEKNLLAHFSKCKHYYHEMTIIVWNISFIMKKYPDDNDIKHFAKNIVLSIYNCHLDEMWENVNRLYKELNAHIKSKHELK